MRRHKAAQHGEGGLWHYVSLSRDGGHPIGYCTLDCQHATADEAREHYRQWMLDGFRYDAMSRDEQRRCEALVPTGTEPCGQWTQRVATGPDGWASYHVCDAHANRAGMETLYPEGSIGESWES